MFRFIYRMVTVSTLLIVPAHAANLDLSSTPLYLGGNVEPNIMFTQDDSGSMHWEYMPSDGQTYYVYPRANDIYGNSDYSNFVPVFADVSYSVRTRSSDINKIYYNPAITYVPWSDSTGASMGNVSVTCAPHNPFDPAKGCRDLTRSNTAVAYWETYNGDGSNFTGNFITVEYAQKKFRPAVYYVYQGGDEWDVASYTKVVIKSKIQTYTTHASRTDCDAAPTCTYAEEIQNFANWYSYYRSRILLSRAGTGRAFAKQGTNLRVGFAAINKKSSEVDGVVTPTVIQGVRSFSGADRASFFSNLYGHDIPTSSTPLRSALADVGEYFKRTDNAGPWAETPGTVNGAEHLTCRQSYNILMTDGYWSNNDPTTVGNSDGVDGVVISGPDDEDFQYIAAANNEPYDDVYSNTLADVAMEYWKNDLRTDLDNEVPKNSLDDAFWQHMVNFTVGLGVTGSLDPATDLPFIAAVPGTVGALDWPNPTTSNETKIDDLWHAAVNSRGEFFSASDPDTFSDSLSKVLSSISERTSSASSVALNSGTVSGNSKVYQARFDSGDWSGQLLAHSINLDGSLGNEVWDAADLIPAEDNRVIVTYDGSNGQPFQWGTISPAQQALLGSESILDYLRGDQSLESSNTGNFRNRRVILGDIIHSSPTFVGQPVSRYPDNWGNGASENSVLYSAFKTSHRNRQDIIYVGANDGMLHGFNADTGAEIFAYVPETLYKDLPDLADINYKHQYYVNGSPTVVDVFFDDAWHSVLVSGLRGGGQGIFALDVTNPIDFSTEASAKEKVLWEFTGDDNSDLGFTYGEPSIVRLQNGRWAAIFSGGYNNTYDDGDDGSTAGDSVSGNAVLYIVDIEDGSLIKKFDTQEGAADDPTGDNRPNGLSTPTVVDFDGDYISDAIYAGDLFGNVWKIDLSGNDASTWDFSYKLGSNDPKPLFTACSAESCDTTNSQPITTQVQVIRHPTLTGYLILFGTGKYFEVGDNAVTGQVTQSYYGVWDKAGSTLTDFDRGDLLEQKIIREITASNFNLRVTTENEIDWTSDMGWYIDLYNTEGENTANYGERQVSNSIVRNDRIIFTTLLPSEDPCEFGGSGWIMELDLYTGSRLSYSPFDIDGDSLFNALDYVNVGDIDGDGEDDYVPASGKKSTVGIIATPSITSASGGTVEYKYTSGSTGAIEVTVENPGPTFNGRQSWRQLDFNF